MTDPRCWLCDGEGIAGCVECMITNRQPPASGTATAQRQTMDERVTILESENEALRVRVASLESAKKALASDLSRAKSEAARIKERVAVMKAQADFAKAKKPIKVASDMHRDAGVKCRTCGKPIALVAGNWRCAEFLMWCGIGDSKHAA